MTPTGPLKEGGGGAFNSDVSAAHDIIGNENEDLDLELEGLGLEAQKPDSEAVIAPPAFAMRHDRLVWRLPAPKIDYGKVGKVQDNAGIKLSRAPIEAVLSPTELRAEAHLKRLERERLSPQDLRAWVRCWDITRLEASRVLHCQEGTLQTALESEERYLTEVLSRRLRRVRWQPRDQILAQFEHRLSRERYVNAKPTNYHFFIVGVKDKALLRRAYTHGLWPGDLLYYRGRAPGQDPKKKPLACAVVHIPSGVAAQASHHRLFWMNRDTAESRLAACVVRWAHEPISRVAYPDRPLVNHRRTHDNGWIVDKRGKKVRYKNGRKAKESGDGKAKKVKAKKRSSRVGRLRGSDGAGLTTANEQLQQADAWPAPSEPEQAGGEGSPVEERGQASGVESAGQ